MTTIVAPPVSVADAPPGSSRTMAQPLTAIRHRDVSTVGGKGANLGEMIAAGFPVPPGFVLPIDAYLQFYESNRLGPRIAAELRNVDVDDPASLERTAAAVRALILGGRVPDDLEDAIHRAYEDLSKTQTLCRRVAVRSSATAEDTAQFSFAGMFESFLNVFGDVGCRRRGQGVLGVDFRRARALLSNQAGAARRDAGGGRRATDGEFREIGRHVHLRPGDARFHRASSSRRRGDWAKRWCRERSRPIATCSTRRRSPC